MDSKYGPMNALVDKSVQASMRLQQQQIEENLWKPNPGKPERKERFMWWRKKKKLLERIDELEQHKDHQLTTIGGHNVRIDEQAIKIKQLECFADGGHDMLFSAAEMTMFSVNRCLWWPDSASGIVELGFTSKCSCGHEKTLSESQLTAKQHQAMVLLGHLKPKPKAKKKAKKDVSDAGSTV